MRDENLQRPGFWYTNDMIINCRFYYEPITKKNPYHTLGWRNYISKFHFKIINSICLQNSIM